jgi:S1-C subfamily serine protease
MAKMRSRLLLLTTTLVLLSACAAPGIRFATSTETTQATNGKAAATATTPGTNQPVPAPTATTAPLPGNIAGSGALSQFQDTLRQIAAAIVNEVVQINTDSGVGSGVVLDSAGDIVTNAHVVSGASSLTVKTSDGKTFPASLVGSFAQNDLAVIKLNGADTKLVPAKFGDSAKVQAGDVVLAVGSPFGLSDTVTEGIVSATGRTQSEGNGVTLTDLIQTSAPINPGNSGGALVDIKGQVIGIPTLSAPDAQGRGQAAAGVGFAISSNQVVSISQQLVANGSVTHTGRAYLGVSTHDDAKGGAAVVSVVSGGPADKAGVKSGWVITAIGGHDVADSNGVSQVLAGLKPGDKVSVAFRLPDGSTRSVSIALGERPINP